MSNKNTFLIIFKDSYKLLFRIVYSIVNDTNDTQDVLQESFLRAFLHFDSKKSYDETLKWLIVISKNTAKTYVKQNRTYEPLENYVNEIGSSDISFLEVFLYDIKKDSIVPNDLCDYLLMNIFDKVSLLEISRNTGISYERLRYWRKKFINELYLWIKDV
jgi:hypothetical protein